MFFIITFTSQPNYKKQEVSPLTLLEPQSHFGDNQFKFQVVCPQIGTAVLKGLRQETHGITITRTPSSCAKITVRIYNRDVNYRRFQSGRTGKYCPSVKIARKNRNRNESYLPGTKYTFSTVQKHLGIQYMFRRFSPGTSTIIPKQLVLFSSRM